MPIALREVLAVLREHAPAGLPHREALLAGAELLLDAYVAVDPDALELARKPENWAAGALHRAGLRWADTRLPATEVARAFGVSAAGLGLVSRRIDAIVPSATQKRLAAARSHPRGEASAPAGPEAMYELRVTLREIAPPVWRRVRVPGRFSLEQTSRVIQAAFGWQGYHLYSFEAEDATDAETVAGVGEGREAQRVSVYQVLRRPRQRLRYVYDFGDEWEHDVVLERLTAPEPGSTRAVLLDGQRAGPPEDCGGPWGYADLLAALADPAHEEHDALRKWLDDCGYPGFRPDRFDRAATARAVAAIW